MLSITDQITRTLFNSIVSQDKVATGLQEIKVKSAESDVAIMIPAVAHSALPFLLLVECGRTSFSVTGHRIFTLNAKFKSILNNTAAMTAKHLTRTTRIGRH